MGESLIVTSTDERRHNRFLYLLLSLLVLFLLPPLLGSGVLHRTVVQIAFSALLISGVYAVAGQKRLVRTGIILVILALGANWLTHALSVDVPFVIAGTRLLVALLLVLTAGMVLHDVVTEREVTVDTIYGSACGYLLVGVVFALLFTALEMVQPGSFGLAIEIAPEGIEREAGLFPYLLYYSFVTLTTLGYGDVTPLTGPTRALASIEALSGQFYIAVLVARLVAIQVASAAAQRTANR